MATRIESKNPFLLNDANINTQYNTFNSGNAAGLWTEHTHHGYFHVLAEPSGGGIYEFILVAIGTQP